MGTSRAMTRPCLTLYDRIRLSVRWGRERGQPAPTWWRGGEVGRPERKLQTVSILSQPNHHQPPAL
ncbi:MAG: hypothetical protein ACK56F_17040, partial [bacterium]